MTPFIILDSVDFIQIPVTDTRVYFPASSHLLGKNIQTITLNTELDGTDITGNYQIFDPENCFITLFDIDGNLIFDKLPLYMLSNENSEIYTINKEVDFERSYIDVNRGENPEAALFFNVFISEYDKQHKPQNNCRIKSVLLFAGAYISGCTINEQEKIYSLSFPVSNQPADISFKGMYALTGKKINRITLSNTNGKVNGYFLIVPKEGNRYINNLALNHLYGYNKDPLPRFIEPISIDFDRTYIYIRPTSEAEYENQLTVNFYYE